MATFADVRISEVLELLRKGYVRSKQSDKGTGSLEEYYNLNARQKKELFSNPKVKNFGRAGVPVMNIIDDTDDDGNPLEDLNVVNQILAQETEEKVREEEGLMVS